MILLIPAQLAFAIERWREVSGQAISTWLEAVGEFEALSSLAGYSARTSERHISGIRRRRAAAVTARGSAHPLLAFAARCVPNDVDLRDGLRVLIVSGSNMSGKSTLLRTVGINAVLALAGAPVRARRLRLSPLAVGASIRIQDSLQEGSSRFYAEITRLRQIVDSDARPRCRCSSCSTRSCSGTNSHDRRIGAEASSGLVERGAIGLVTTHDLALAQSPTSSAARRRTSTSRTSSKTGRMTFDYRMRPGVVQERAMRSS